MYKFGENSINQVKFVYTAYPNIVNHKFPSRGYYNLQHTTLPTLGSLIRRRKMSFHRKKNGRNLRKSNIGDISKPGQTYVEHTLCGQNRKIAKPQREQKTIKNPTYRPQRDRNELFKVMDNCREKGRAILQTKVPIWFGYVQYMLERFQW